MEREMFNIFEYKPTIDEQIEGYLRRITMFEGVIEDYRNRINELNRQREKQGEKSC
jgi:hypothetical protein